MSQEMDNHTSQHYYNVSEVLAFASMVYTYANAHQEAHHVRLLLLLKFLDILKGTHLSGC
jgi:hypothetical protein